MSIPERAIAPEVAEDWIRETLRQDPRGARLSVSGTCMEPALKEGTRITLKPVGGPVRVGDVVLLRTVAGLRLHRVLVNFGNRVRTKGDRGYYLDPATPVTGIIAVCETDDPRWIRLIQVLASLARLLARPFSYSPLEPERGDAAHARLLP